MAFVACIVLISVAIAIMDIMLAKKSFGESKKEGFYLGCACLLAALVDVSYLLSIMTENHFLFACLTSVYFISIDIMLNFLVKFMFIYTKLPENRILHRIFQFSLAYMAVDILLLISNPWTCVCMEYLPRNTILAKYSYVMKFPYYGHLIYAYLLLAFVIGVLVYKSVKVAREYRKPYRANLFGILAVIIVNAVFLFLDNSYLVSLLDVSIWGYSIVGFSLYWSCFTYPRNGMMLDFKSNIFDKLQITLHALKPSVSISMGVTISDADSTFNSLYQKADEALYLAKNNGRDRMEFV